ncbi:DUF2510 domain-containing protein [Nocardioides sp. zg-536]|uniref:DUF2510 domain-containing protein n=1 Tax=Nocardioides faecalis TaxID=2803858 RepID=A0A938Y5A8_9ACTN|nr:DUF2510 domain-containing protein [Nocardioides faecalis]MBM9459487.1 DUF2510 domain-containing protein [Nocardioides faecalis]MBS4751728.1 DUF2510 domain-containing protein [Nocardioides faecalis]QVI59412.1 DUF2510 domain-containing protein [Nocardioides faecalis]
MNEFSTPAGWYPDGDGWERRWDGTGWTEDRRRMAEPTQVRPTPPGPTPPGPPPTQLPQQPGNQPGNPAGGPPKSPAGPTFGAQPPFPPAGPSPYAPPPPPPGYGNVAAGFPPHPGRGTNGPGGPAGPGRPGGSSGPKKSRLGVWLGIAAALLLIVGIAVTVAVLKPWQGEDDSTAGPDKGPGGKGGDKKAAVQGDIDGDNKGDALFYLYQNYDDIKKVTAKSTGNGFELAHVAADPYTEPQELYLDWDGDGVNEKLVWRFVASGKQITLSSNDSDFPGDQTFTLPLSSLKKYGDIEIRLVHGDFDGDGDLDLAIAGPNDRVVDVSVLLNDGKGTFAEPVLWLSLPNAVIDVVQITAGDFDGDGDADLWAELPAERLTNESYTEYYSGDRGFALLTSSGNAFTQGAVNKSTIYAEEFLAGDVTGDGTVNIVAVETNSYREQITVTVYDVSAGTLKPVTGFTGTSKIGQRSLQGATLSDVDGDGKADVVFVVKAYKEAKFTGLQVMRSTGAVFDPALVWADLEPCKDDSCRVRFVGSRRY